MVCLEAGTSPNALPKVERVLSVLRVTLYFTDWAPRRLLTTWSEAAG